MESRRHGEAEGDKILTQSGRDEEYQSRLPRFPPFPIHRSLCFAQSCRDVFYQVLRCFDLSVMVL